MDNNTIKVSNENGEEKVFQILFTFENDEKKYVLYYDDTEAEPSVFAQRYDEEGHLFDVETAEEWEIINEVFESFMSQDEGEETDEHECGCGCGHHHHDENHECGCGCDHDHDDDHECCCGHDHDEDHECGCGCDHDHEEEHECECGCHHHE